MFNLCCITVAVGESHSIQDAFTMINSRQSLQMASACDGMVQVLNCSLISTSRTGCTGEMLGFALAEITKGTVVG